MSRARSPIPEPRLAASALLVGLALLVGRGQGRFPESPLVDTSAWNLETPDVAGRIGRMREAITGPPDEAKRRWARMMKARRIAPPPVPPPRGAGPTGGFGSSENFTFGVSPEVQVPRLLEGVVQEALARKSERVAGSGDMGPMLRQSGGGPPSLLLRRGPQLGDVGRSYLAGEPAETPVKYDELTRWQRGKEVLQALGRAYVVQDIGEFMRQFSVNAALDLTILRNAVQEDFEQDADIQLDFELLEFRLTFDTIHVRLRWLRSSTLQNGTPAAVTEGTSDILLDRHDAFRIKSWRGLPPFGARDAAFLKQVKAGAPNALLEGDADGSATPPPSGSPPPSPSPSPPPIETIPTFFLFSSGSICIDFDAATPQTVGCGGGAQDVQISNNATGPGVSYDVDDFGQGVEECDDSTPLGQYRSMSFPTGVSFTGSTAGPEIFSALTTPGIHVLFSVEVSPIGGTGDANFDVSLMRRASSTIYPDGTATCP